MSLAIDGLALVFNCRSSCVVVIDGSMSVPSGDVMSSGHHELDVILCLMANLVQ